MLGFNIIAADTEDEARFLKTSVLQSFVNRSKGQRGKLPAPIAGYEEQLSPAEREMLENALSCSATGAPATVEREIAAFVEKTGADELMITCNIHDFAKRLHSFELVGEMISAAS